MREFLGAAMGLRGSKVAVCVMIGFPIPFPFAVEVSIEHGHSELLMPRQWDFPWIP
jgi:hypothetical protein